MRCRFCGVDDDKVIDSRSVNQGFSIRRRRICSKCGRRYTTYERLEEPIKVIKKDMSREKFDRAKIRQGLELAFKKRPVSAEALIQIVDDIEADVMTRDAQEVTTELVGNLVMKHLRSIDQVAYVRFASVYRDFKDVDDFMKHVQEVQRSGGEDLPVEGQRVLFSD